MSLRSYEQSVAWARNKVINPGQNWAYLCQMFSHECIGAAPFGDVDPAVGSRTAKTAWQWGVANNCAYTGPPPPGSLAYFEGGATGHAVFVTDGGMVFSTPYGSLTGTTTGIGVVSFRAFPHYLGYITRVPEGPIDIRSLGSSNGSSVPARGSSSDSGGTTTTGQSPSATVDPPAYAANPGQSTTNSRLDVSPAWRRISGQINYNPPLVRSAMHNEGFGPASDTFFSGGEVTSSLGGSLNLTSGAPMMGRLGRIVPELTQSSAYGAGGYGFRFLYNPASYGESISVDPNIAANVAATDTANSMAPNSSFSFSLYLNRIEDMRYTSYPGSAAYPVPITQNDWEGITQFGTLWDVEYLFRTINGQMRDTWRGTTSEFGIIVGVPCRFYLGRGRRLRGRIVSVTMNHLMFTKDMVPILTAVQVNVLRYPDTAGDIGEDNNFLNPEQDASNTAKSSDNPYIKLAAALGGSLNTSSPASNPVQPTAAPPAAPPPPIGVR